MVEVLSWEKLLSSERERPSSRKIQQGDSIIARNKFEADYDRATPHKWQNPSNCSSRREDSMDNL